MRMNNTPEHVQDVCRIGEGADACKYLGRSRDGFTCLKVIPAHKAMLDARTNMNAQGDNCDGIKGTIR